MNITKIVEKINGGATLDDIATKQGVSRSTICRALRNEGYSYNRSIKMYFKKGYILSDKISRSYSMSADTEKKLKLYAIENRMTYSEVIEHLINKYC